ncbi:ABC-type multidrug transport system, ATPase component [Halorhabdus sp. SVX81]|uniref:ABC transporter ATP-binding protein n=1 Tax=Halorhabdus sp. SVX81 TaxID=2978283 RepID=UPI0023DA66C8|nr:ABC transporter ATP-binding protein [Halorhabdus sp. SVX81]WEL18996.1 ABC-type multidrug transport system, ATPase component [Halorhabdus sp. SVX81]
MKPIELTDVEKSYGKATSLEAISLSFEPGWHIVLGPNGAGKTTLFRLLLGLTDPDAGQLSIPDGSVGCSFQEPQVYEGLTVRENLETFGEIAGSSTDWLETLLERCGLTRMAHRPAGALSAGFRSRLDVALAFVNRPDIVLLDEPLADVDDEYVGRLREFFLEYAGPDRLFVVATHHHDRFIEIADTVTILADGRVQWTGDPATAPAHDGDITELYRDSISVDGT